jgi:hypothetical protein
MVLMARKAKDIYGFHISKKQKRLLINSNHMVKKQRKWKIKPIWPKNLLTHHHGVVLHHHSRNTHLVLSIKLKKMLREALDNGDKKELWDHFGVEID